jgi:hypothetical protein
MERDIEKKKQYNKEYYLNNKEKLIQKRKEYRLNNKEKQKQYKKEYYLNNKEKQKQYYLNNKEKQKQYKKEYYLNNKEKIKQKTKEYCLNNKEKIKQWRLNNREKQKQYKKEYYLNNKEKIKQKCKQWRLNNKKHIREYYHKYEKERFKIDPNYKLVKLIRNRIKSVLKGIYKSKSTIKLLGCSIEECWQHLESKFQPGMTRENHGLWHVDHIRPCALFDLKCPVQQLACFHYTNLQPLWAIDNIKKGARYD